MARLVNVAGIGSKHYDRRAHAFHPGSERVSPDGPGRHVSIREVAKRAGVATTSVSRVLRNHPDVSVSMRRRVQDAVHELGYEPNVLAQSLRRGATHSIGFVVRDISNPLLSHIALAAERVMHEHGYAMLLTNSEGLASREAEYIGLLRRRRVDGLLLSLAQEDHGPTTAELRRLLVPFVLVDRELHDGAPFSAVYCDDAGGIRAAARHLIELGHRTIGLVCGPLELKPGREEARALAEFCGPQGVEAVVEPGDFGEEHAVAAVGRMLGSPSPPTAIVVGSVLFLEGVLAALRSHGLRVPDDVSVVGFDEAPFVKLLDPPIAVVSREPRAVGRAAAEVLLRLLDGAPPEQVTVPTTLQPGASTAPPRRSALART